VNKKVLFSLGALLLFITIIVSFFAIVKPTPISQANSESSVQQAPIKVAVVNEDAGKVYNGQQINIANTLVNSFISKNNYKVEVVSRSIAESGLKNDTYQLMIVFPSKFSEEALAIESTSPIQATFQYQIQSNDQLTVKQAEQAVVAFKELFNKDLINIYFTSIIGNLKTAQGQVADVVTNEQESLSTFNNKLVGPLAQYSQQFNGLSSSPNNLLSVYSSFNKDLLNPDILKEVFLSGTDVLTRVQDSVPTTYGENAIVKNSILGDGCEINGIVENSILFRDVVIEEGAVVKNSIIMPNTVIKKAAYIDYVISDKAAVVSEKVELKGTENCQVIIEKNKVVE